MNEIIKTIAPDLLLLELNKDLYEYDTILQTTYKFTDKCYIKIDYISNDIIGVYFKAKEDYKGLLENIIGDFCNELIDQQVRIITEKKYSTIREEIVKKAFSPIS